MRDGDSQMQALVDRQEQELQQCRGGASAMSRKGDSAR